MGPISNTRCYCCKCQNDNHAVECSPHVAIIVYYSSSRHHLSRILHLWEILAKISEMEKGFCGYRKNSDNDFKLI